jgi:hypothetical protein
LACSRQPNRWSLDNRAYELSTPWSLAAILPARDLFFFQESLIPCRESGRHRGSSPPTQTALPAAHIRETCSLLAPLLQDCRQQAAAAGDRANRLEVEPMAAMHRPIEALTRMSALEGLCRCCPRLSVLSTALSNSASARRRYSFGEVFGLRRLFSCSSSLRVR